MARVIHFDNYRYKVNGRFEKGFIHDVTYQGSFLHWKVRHTPSEERLPSERGEVTYFSAKSRMRLIEKLARIDWMKAGKTLFVTLTFPPKYVNTPMRKVNQWLHQWRREAEKELGEQKAILWRCEWKEHETGERKNYLFPHFHLMIFNTRWLHRDKTNSMWKKVIGYNDYCRTETKGMKNKQQAMYYVCKYHAKCEGSLVYGPYLNNIQSGRHWGIFRNELYPYGAEFKSDFKDDELLSSAYAYAKDKLPSKRLQANESFRLFGENAEEIGQILFGTKLDGEIIDV